MKQYTVTHDQYMITIRRSMDLDGAICYLPVCNFEDDSGLYIRRQLKPDQFKRQPYFIIGWREWHANATIECAFTDLLIGFERYLGLGTGKAPHVLVDAYIDYTNELLHEKDWHEHNKWLLERLKHNASNIPAMERIKTHEQ